MIKAAVGFFILAILAFVVGATGLAGMSMEIGQMMLMVFLALAVLSFLVSLMTGKDSREIQ